MNIELTSENIFTYIKISGIFPKYPITRIRLKKPWSTEPRKSKFLAQYFLTFPEKNNPHKISYTFSKKPTQPKFLIFFRVRLEESIIRLTKFPILFSKN